MEYYRHYMEKVLREGTDKKELKDLIKKYNELTGSFLFIYYGAMSSLPNVENTLCHNDYYKIFDMLKDCHSKKIDFFIVTPGGSGDAAKEIGNFLQEKFENINFVIAGEAKSAGTILAMCADEISMTKTGCLGPIDAQMMSPKGVYSAYDYVEWVEKKKMEMENLRKKGKQPYLDPVDAIMVSQISPGELGKAKHALEFGKDIIKEWLNARKFKNWTTTETKNTTVTDKMRSKRASEVAEKLADHSYWRDHGRSIKYHELLDLLKINLIDNDPTLSDIIYRIHTICNLQASFLNVFKILGAEEGLLFMGTSLNPTPLLPIKPIIGNPAQNPLPDAIKADIAMKGFLPIKIGCDKCGQPNDYTICLSNDKTSIDNAKKQNGFFVPVSETSVKCLKCGNDIDISALRENLNRNI